MLRTARNIFFLFLALLIAELVCVKIVLARNNIKIEDLPVPARSHPVTVESINTARTTSFLATPAQVQKKRIASLSFAWNTLKSYPNPVHL